MGRKVQKTTIAIKFDPLKVGRGHPSHRSGSGVHTDRRLKRLRTRGNAARHALATQ